MIPFVVFGLLVTLLLTQLYPLYRWGRGLGSPTHHTAWDDLYLTGLLVVFVEILFLWSLLVGLTIVRGVEVLS